MAALPALTKAYSVRANAPFQANSTILLMNQSVLFSLKQHMINNTGFGGTVGGTRHTNSIWTVKSSSNGVTMGTLNDNVDRWTTHTDLVYAASGTAHSWIILENATLGYQVCIECVPALSTSIGFAVTPIAFPFTGGSITTRPTSVGAIGEVVAGSTSTGAGVVTLFLSDQALGNLNWTHYVTANDGQFYFMVSRTGGGLFSGFIGLVKTINNRIADTYNVFALQGGSVNTGRGSPTYSSLITATGCIGRHANGTINSTFGAQAAGTFGGATYAGGEGVDALTGNHLAFPIHIAHGGTQPGYRGEIPDLYYVSTAAVGASVPSTVSQDRVIVGDFIIPFPTVNPNV